MTNLMRACLLIVVAGLSGCAAPGKSRLARAAFLVMPQSVSVGILAPADGLHPMHRGYASLTFNWLLKPAYLPVPMPSLK